MKARGERVGPTAEYLRDWRRRNPEASRAMGRRHLVKLRAECFAAYGDACACCGERTPEFLTIDHVHDDGAAHRRTLTIGMYQALRGLGYPRDDYQLLCMNCNFAKSKRGGCPHQRRLTAVA
jgi:hypothetical protein